MVQIDTGRFLNELGRLFEKAKAKDSVRITLKRSKCTPADQHHALMYSLVSSRATRSERGHASYCRQSKSKKIEAAK